MNTIIVIPTDSMYFDQCQVSQVRPNFGKIFADHAHANILIIIREENPLLQTQNKLSTKTVSNIVMHRH